jgi:pSer/pThr/pTyr-binding forkhead associated (FHA) protein
MEEQTVVLPGGVGVGEATRVMTTPPGAEFYGDRTQQAIAVNCPVCGTPNGPGDIYCQDCGLLFTSVSGSVEQLPESTDLPRLVDESGREFLLNPGVNTVGREYADVLIADSTISRKHATITLEQDRLLIEDLGSTNGTAVGGERVTPGGPVGAYNGDNVKFGNVSLTVTMPGGGGRPAALPPPAPVTEQRAKAGAMRLADGTEYPLYEGVNTVGRRSTNQVVLADAFASGSHAEIRVENGAATLVDVGSTNGTFIDGERVAAQTPIPIPSGMTVTFGKTPITFELYGAAAEVPAAEPVEEAAGEGDPDNPISV